MRVAAQDLFKVAYARYAIGAYNVQNMEQILGVFRGSLEAQAPVILAVVPHARAYAGGEMLEAMLQAAEKMYPEVVYAAHLDHGDEDTCWECLASGFYGSIMVDASHLPFEQNVAITRQVVERAHRQGVSVEAELGVVAGLEGRSDINEPQAMLTDPDQAAEFVRLTGCDSLAVAIGTSHGAYKFKGQPALHLDRLAEIQRRLPPGFPLVLHGASSVPREEVERINAAGGRMNASARGVAMDDLRRACQLGVTKINVHTDALLLWTRVHREFFRDQPDAYDFRHPGSLYVGELARLVVNKSQQLGSANRLAEVRAALGC